MIEETTTAIYQIVSGQGGMVITSYAWTAEEAIAAVQNHTRMYSNVEVRNRGDFVPDSDEIEWAPRQGVKVTFGTPQRHPNEHKCDVCGETFDAGEWEFRHSTHEDDCPNYGLEDIAVPCDCDLHCHPDCCPACNKDNGYYGDDLHTGDIG